MEPNTRAHVIRFDFEFTTGKTGALLHSYQAIMTSGLLSYIEPFAVIAHFQLNVLSLKHPIYVNLCRLGMSRNVDQ
jgi:hypothetical protein